MSKGEKCEGGEGIAHLIRVGVGTFQVNKKQIVTAEQSHLWRFNTLIHTNAHTHDTHTRANCLYAMWNFSLRACNPFQATRFALSIPPSLERTFVSLISDIFTVCGTQDAYK